MIRSRLLRGPLGCVVLALACLVGSAARADEQSDRIKTLEKRLEENAKLIAENARVMQALAARVAELERAAALAKSPSETKAASNGEPKSEAATPAAAAASHTHRAIADLQHSVAQISEGLSKRNSNSDNGLPLHGFADVQAGWSSAGDPARLRGFNGGTLDLYLTPQFGDRVKSLIELAVEYEPNGQGFIDMERLQVGYVVSDSLTTWVGRFHTPFGLWNTAFHHGANLQTSITRPRFIDFEDKGGIIPAHSVGAWASGKHPLGQGKLTYDAYLSNGPSIRGRELDFNAFTDDNNGKMVGFNLGYQAHGELSGLSVGVYGFGSQVNSFANSKALIASTRLRMAGMYVGYDESDYEVFGEYYRFANVDDGDAARHRSSAWFMHVGRTFGSLTPYVRLERALLDPGDRYFLALGAGRSYSRTVVGARYTIDARSSLKLELSNTSESPVLQFDENGLVVPYLGGKYRRAGFEYSIAF